MFVGRGGLACLLPRWSQPAQTIPAATCAKCRLQTMPSGWVAYLHTSQPTSPPVAQAVTCPVGCSTPVLEQPLSYIDQSRVTATREVTNLTAGETFEFLLALLPVQPDSTTAPRERHQTQKGVVPCCLAMHRATCQPVWTAGFAGVSTNLR